MFLSRLNEVSGGCQKILSFSLSFWSNLKFFKMMFLFSVVQNNRERALATYKRTLPVWLRYVDDTFTAVQRDEIDDF